MEAPETEALSTNNLERSAPPVDEPQLRSDLVTLAAEYHAATASLNKNTAERQKVQDTLAIKLAELKAARVGKGREGGWGPFVKDQLNLRIRTVDRWIRKKLVDGDLPEWAAQKLTANQRKPQRQVKNGQVESNVEQNRAPARADTETPKSFADWSALTKSFFAGLPKTERGPILAKALRVIRDVCKLGAHSQAASSPEPGKTRSTEQGEHWTHEVKEDGTTEFSRSKSPFETNRTLTAPIVQWTKEELAKH